MMAMEMIFYIFIILIVGIMVFLFTRGTNRKYDERQKAFRDRSYKWGFWSVMIYQMILGMININYPHLPRFLFTMVPIYLGIFIVLTYQVIHGAYISLNYKPTKLNTAFYIILGILEGYFGVTSFMDKQWESAIAYSYFAMFLLVLGIANLYMMYMRNKGDE